MSGIGTLGEGPLHAALKQVLAEPGDRSEVAVSGFVIDLVRPGELVEIQTGSFTRMKKKLETLLPEYRVRLVYPLIHEAQICRAVREESGHYDVISRRKSPLKRGVYHIFDELTAIGPWLTHPNFRLEVISVRVQELRAQTGRRVWRRQGWEVVERRLEEVLDATLYDTAEDWLKLLPVELPTGFDTGELATAAGISRALAQKLCYAYLHAGLIERVDKRGNAHVYSRCPA